MVLVVPPVEDDCLGVEEEAGEEDGDDLHALRPSVHKVPVEDVGVLRRRVPILNVQFILSSLSLVTSLRCAPFTSLLSVTGKED